MDKKLDGAAWCDNCKKLVMRRVIDSSTRDKMYKEIHCAECDRVIMIDEVVRLPKMELASIDIVPLDDNATGILLTKNTRRKTQRGYRWARIKAALGIGGWYYHKPTGVVAKRSRGNVFDNIKKGAKYFIGIDWAKDTTRRRKGKR